MWNFTKKNFMRIFTLIYIACSAQRKLNSIMCHPFGNAGAASEVYKRVPGYIIIIIIKMNIPQFVICPSNVCVCVYGAAAAVYIVSIIGNDWRLKNIYVS